MTPQNAHETLALISKIAINLLLTGAASESNHNKSSECARRVGMLCVNTSRLYTVDVINNPPVCARIY